MSRGENYRPPGQDDPGAPEMLARAAMQTAAGGALEHVHSYASTIKEYVQRGPDGVGYLCFVGGGLTSFWGFMSLINIFNLMLDPIDYAVHVYELLFGITTCVLEAPKNMVEQSQKIQRFRMFLHEYAKFLTTLGGRGLFYLFQGSVTYATQGVSLATILALYMVGVGCICIAMQFGWVPADTPPESRPDADSDYIRVLA